MHSSQKLKYTTNEKTKRRKVVQTNYRTLSTEFNTTTPMSLRKIGFEMKGL